jgi:hypothetical protein
VQWRGSPALIQQRFILFFGEISPTGDKNKPSATSRKEFKKRTSRTFAMFLRKKKKKKRKNLPDLDSESM